MDDTIRKRNRGLRGKAFRFSGTFTGFTSDSSQHDHQINEFNKRVGDSILATKQGHVTLDSISYMVLPYEIARLSSTETCDVPVIGYIQSTTPVYANHYKNGWGTSSSGNWYPEDCVDPLNLRGKFRIPGKEGSCIRFTESLEQTI